MGNELPPVSENSLNKLDERWEKSFAEGINNGSTVPASSEQFSKILSDMRFIRERYGIRPQMHDINRNDQPGIVAERMEFKDAVRAVEIFREELGKYPPEMIRNSDISQFRIMEKLSVGATSLSVITLGVTYESGEMYVANGDDDLTYRETIHHEIWHRFDYERYESKDTSTFLQWLDDVRDAAIDKDWENLHEEGEKAYVGDDWNSMTEERPKGFVNKYGRKSPKEDRASIAQMLMTRPKELAKLCEEDELLNIKVNMLKELYFKDSDEVMDDDYFQALLNGEVNEKYWDGKNEKTTI